MKNYIIPICLLACFIIAGCGTSTKQETLTAPDQATIVLTDEEVEVLASSNAESSETAPVTKDNYEEALKALEEEMEAEQ